ncbi:MAG: PKD domain-containing protein [Candidatus Bathyarchaeia archaeon]
MKNKVLSILITLTLLLGVFAISKPASASYPPPGTEALYAYPDVKDLTGNVPTKTYTFDIMITPHAAVTTISFSLHYDPHYVNITNIAPDPNGVLTGGSFLIGDWFLDTGNITDILWGKLGGYWDITTDVAVFRITVAVLAFTPSTGTVIDIYAMNCWDDIGNNFLVGDSPYDHTVIMPPIIVIVQPTAAFNWTPSTPTVGDTVTFDASASTGGYDGHQSCPITEYRWDWEGDGTIDEVTSNAIITHVFSSAGTYHVTLTVYAPGGPSAEPSYVPTASITHDVLVKAPAVGRIIDLYTQNTRHPDYTTDKTGEGIDSSVTDPSVNRQVDSYAPQDLVTLYAKVTYNNAPVANKEVAFEIHGPTNNYQNIIIYRQAFTDANGIATIDFRIPWPDEHAKDIVFGNWTIMAKVDIAEQWVSDSHWFYVHWIIDIENVQLLDSAYTPTVDFVRGVDTAYINVTVYNWAMTSRNATITVVIYDELGVPVGTNVINFNNIPGETAVSQITNIPIPNWAYVGYGNVYVNAFTKLPWECGVCYCPEYPPVTIHITLP